MLGAALSSIALFASLAGALPIEKQAAEKIDGTIGYLPVNEGWMNFPFGPAGTETPIMFNLFCPGVMNITDLMCSGDRFEIFDNGVLLGNTSRPVFNHCHSNSTCPDFTQTHHNWSHGSFDLLPGWHNVTIKVVRSPYHGGSGAIRVDTIKEKQHKPCPCTVDVCHITRKDLVVVKTHVPRCQAESVCQSLGMHLANIDIDNFLDATTLAFQCSGASSQSWVDDWNGDNYQGTCLVLSTGAAAPGGAINKPNCCSAKLPVVCQKKPCNHPRVHYSCNACQSSCFCRDGHCKKCHHGHCEHAPKCGLLM